MRKREAERTRKAAQKSTDSLASWESAEYWTFRQQKVEATLEINEIDEEIGNEEKDSKKKEQSRNKYLKRKAKLKNENESAARKVRRYAARAQIVEDC